MECISLSHTHTHPIPHHDAETVLPNVVRLELAVPSRIVISIPDISPAEPIERIGRSILLGHVIVTAVIERRPHVQAVESVLGVVSG